MIELVVYMFIVVLVVTWCYYKWQNRRFVKLAARMTGPPAYPIIGTGYQFIGSSERNGNNNVLKHIKCST